MSKNVLQLCPKKACKKHDRGDLFEGLSIWEEEKYRKLQGTYPVISLSFARVKENNYEDALEKYVKF